MGASQYLNRIAEIKSKFGMGQISYDEAKKLLAPVVDEMNARGRQIAQENGVTHKPISATSLLR